MCKKYGKDIPCFFINGLTRQAIRKVIKVTEKLSTYQESGGIMIQIGVRWGTRGN